MEAYWVAWLIRGLATARVGYSAEVSAAAKAVLKVGLMVDDLVVVMVVMRVGTLAGL
jgi:hypothetical protein